MDYLESRRRQTSLPQGTQFHCGHRRWAAGGLGILHSVAVASGCPTPRPAGTRDQEPLQPPGLTLFLGLLPAQRHLGSHDALALGDQGALGTRAVPPAAEAFVALECRHDAMVATTGAFGCPRVAAAHRTHTPLQSRSRPTASASRGGCGCPQKEAGWPQESWRNWYPGGYWQRRRRGWRGSRHQPRGQVGSAATAAVSAATL